MPAVRNPPPLSATILSFLCPLGAAPKLGAVERARAAAWAARLDGRGAGHWRVETHLDDEGGVWLGIVTPSSRGLREEDRSLSWLLSCEGGGMVVTRMPSGRVWGVFGNLARALAAVESAEARPSQASPPGPAPRQRRRALPSVKEGRPGALATTRVQITLDHSAGASR